MAGPEQVADITTEDSMRMQPLVMVYIYGHAQKYSSVLRLQWVKLF
jgi:hypothetical protein